MNYSTEKAANAIKAKADVIKRAINLGAIQLTDDGLITPTELAAFAAEGFKHNRYDKEGNKLPGAKS
jgi:hypothetical protein